jgi:hypothetical protein
LNFTKVFARHFSVIREEYIPPRYGDVFDIRASLRGNDRGKAERKRDRILLCPGHFEQGERGVTERILNLTKRGQPDDVAMSRVGIQGIAGSRAFRLLKKEKVSFVEVQDAVPRGVRSMRIIRNDSFPRCIRGGIFVWIVRGDNSPRIVRADTSP